MKTKLILSLITALTIFSAAHADNRCLDRMNQRIENDTLNLSECHLQDTDMPRILDFLAVHKNITKLDISNNNIHDQGLVSLMATTTIDSLYINFYFSLSPKNKISLNAITAFANNTKLKTLALNDANISNEAAIILAKSKTLTSLEAEGNYIGTSGAIALAQNTSLTSLNINFNNAGIGDEGAAAFAKNTNLNSLGVIFNGISDAGLLLLANHPTLSELKIGERDKRELSKPVLEALAENPHLTSLEIYYMGIMRDTGAAILAKSKSLKELDLDRKEMGDAGAIAIASNPRLSHVELIWNNIGSQGASALAKIPALTVLDLSLNNIDSIGAIELAKSNTLTELWLDGCDIDNSGAVALANNHTIEKLILSSNPIGDEGAIALANNPILTELRLGYTKKLTTQGIQALAHNTHLTKLYLTDYLPETALDAKALSALAENKTLNFLSLAHNWIRDVNMLKFAASTHTPELYLMDNKIGDAGAIAFANNTHINNLDLRDNPIGPNGMQALLSSPITYLDVDQDNLLQSKAKNIRKENYQVSRKNKLIYCKHHQRITICK